MSLIRLSKSSVGDEEKEAISKIIDAGYLGMGEEVRLFEQDIKSYLGTGHEVICVNTGTAALHLSLQAIGIGFGDEVIVPSLTYVASFQSISATGATPVPCDVDLKTGFIDLIDAEKRVNVNTKAIMPVHYASNSMQMEGVYEFAKKHKLRVVEDAAHGFGCKRNGVMIGCEGDVICFSFDGIKNITSGEGGAIVTGDQAVANKIRDARLLGVEKDTEQRYRGSRSWKFNVKHQGWRYHMSNLMAAIGREQLKKLDKFAINRKKNVEKYQKELSGIAGLRLLDIDYSEIVPHIFPLRILQGKRDGLMEGLRKNNIESGIHYFPNHLLDLYQSNYDLPNVELLYEELLSLPLHSELTPEEQNRVISIIKDYLL